MDREEWERILVMKRIRNTFLDLIKRLTKGETSGKVLFLVGGTVTGQGIYMLTMPLLSRLYSPSDFGILAVYASLLGILASITGFGYHLAIPLPKDDVEATHLLFLALFFHGGLTVVLVLVFALWGVQILSLFQWSSLIPYLWFLPVGFFATGIYTIVSYYALRQEAFRTLGRTKVTQKIFGAGISILLGKMGGTAGLLWGQVAGMAGGILSLVKETIKRPVAVTGKCLLLVGKKYRKFPLYQQWGGLLNILSNEIMPLLLFAFFSEEMTGWFSMSLRMVQIPAVLLGQAIGQVYYQRASVAHREGTLPAVTFSTLRSLVLMGTFPILSLGVIAPVLFPLLFGERWEVAGEYSLILAPFLWLQFLSSPISSIFMVVSRQRLLMFFQGFMLTVGVLSLYLGHLTGGVYLPIVIYSLGKVLVYFVYLVVIMHISDIRLAHYAPVVLRELVFGIMLCAPVIGGGLFSQGILVPLSVWAIVGFYYIIRLFQERQWKEGNHSRSFLEK